MSELNPGLLIFSFSGGDVIRGSVHSSDECPGAPRGKQAAAAAHRVPRRAARGAPSHAPQRTSPPMSLTLI